MLSVSDLVDLGFLRSQAGLLLDNADFILHVKSWDKNEFKSRMDAIEKVYGVSREQVVKAVFTSPQFAGLDHSRVL
ncbi:MAG: hypothetical protein HY393_00005, partial [Candidatus Diapherotrites archaeon]|nr:hypothetical protein [Candidatus Diapherotrites archaeon]